MKKQLTSVEIATEVLRLIKMYKRSWDGYAHTKGDWWYDNVAPFLDKQTYSAFAQTLLVFACLYAETVISICKTVIKHNKQ